MDDHTSLSSIQESLDHQLGLVQSQMPAVRVWRPDCKKLRGAENMTTWPGGPLAREPRSSMVEQILQQASLALGSGSNRGGQIKTETPGL